MTPLTDTAPYLANVGRSSRGSASTVLDGVISMSVVNNNNNNNNNNNKNRKDTQEWTLIDIAVSAEQNIISTEEGKVDRYQDLAFEIKRIHRASKVTVIPIVLGALGTVSRNAKSWHGKLDILDIVGSRQSSAIRETAHTKMREVAET